MLRIDSRSKEEGDQLRDHFNNSGEKNDSGWLISVEVGSSWNPDIYLKEL